MQEVQLKTMGKPLQLHTAFSFMQKTPSNLILSKQVLQNAGWYNPVPALTRVSRSQQILKPVSKPVCPSI
jgi:hypothetical protein